MTSTEENGLLGRPAELPEGNRTLSPPRQRLSQSRLYNFSFPNLSWGCHKILRCTNIKDSVAGEATGSAAPAATQHDPGVGLKRSGSSPSREKSHPPRASPGGRASKEVDGRATEEGEGEESSSSAAAAAAAAAAAMRPWNLRSRRAACNAPVENERRRNPSSAAGSPSPLPAKKSKPLAKSVRLSSDGAGKRLKFSISLSRDELEEDFMLFKGTKPPRRPKKRPRIVQNQLDSLFPGLWLSEITPRSYKIDESKRM